MEMRTLGRTGLSVSVMGLGCGGHSRLGLSQNRGDDNAIAVVQRALALGVNFIDTAESYGTESVVGRALASAATPREQIVLSTKVSLRGSDGNLRTSAEFRAAADERLRLLQTEYVDILHLHGVPPKDYAYCQSELIPALLTLCDAGKVRFPGITEGFVGDPGHQMLVEGALQDDVFDVMMVGFSVLNQSARERVFPVTQAKGVGTLDMFAVRRALSQPDALNALLDNLAAQGKVRRDDFATGDGGPLGFVTEGGASESVPDAAYRFCRDEPGVDVVLVGTGSIEHLEANAASLSRPPLPDTITARLHALFADVDSVSGN